MTCSVTQKDLQTTCIFTALFQLRYPLTGHTSPLALASKLLCNDISFIEYMYWNILEMDTAVPNYFTCTLGQAEELQHHAQALPPFSSIIGLIDEQATRLPNNPALGFPCTKTKDSSLKC